MSSRYLFCGVIFLAVTLSTALPQAMGQTVIYSVDPTHPNSLVPFQGDGARFDPASSNVFNRPRFSPDGSQWIFKGENNGASSVDSMLVRGSSFSANQILREGNTIPFNSELYGSFSRSTDINNNGDFVFGNNTNGPMATDQYLIKWDNTAGSYVNVAQEGFPAAGFPGIIYDSSNSYHQIAANGRVSYLGDLDVTSSLDRVFYRGSTPLAREGTTVPTGAANSGGDPYRLLSNSFGSVDNSDNWLLNADINNSATGNTFDVITINNDIVLHENGTLPGLARPLGEDGGTTFDWAEISGNGDWLARGSASYQQTGAWEVQKWVALNGSLIAAGGEPIFAGSSETWDFDESDTFDFSVHNDLGDVVIGGQLTSGEKALVYIGSLGEFVLMREGDAVDYDGNGLFDDATFLGGLLGADRAALSNDGRLLFVSAVDDATGSSISARTLISVQAVPEPSSICLLALASLTVLGRRRRR